MKTERLREQNMILVQCVLVSGREGANEGWWQWSQAGWLHENSVL